MIKDRLYKNSKGQSLTEYAIVLGIVAAALLSMQPFIKRSIQGILKDSADAFGNQEAVKELTPLFGTTETSAYVTESSSKIDYLAEAGSSVTTERANVKRTGNIARQERLD
ncbi:MAG: hypothetical protein AB1629_04940 [Candidatus Omnitrophota bacterium]